MIYSSNKGEIYTNLAGDSYQKLTNGIWKLGLINDNPGIDNEESSFYQDFSRKVGSQDIKGRCFKNKVNVVLADNSTITAHIIHWVKSDGYFCISVDRFWDQFD